jgi:cytochrome c oxidase assembly protein Cox11
MLVGLGSAVGIWYSLLGFNAFFLSIIEFALVFVPIYVCTCVILGWQDFKRGVYQREVEVQRAENKITIEILENLREIISILKRE